MATTKDPFDHMRAVIRSHGIAACHFPNFEVVRAPDHYPPTRYNNGVRFHAKVTNEKWKGKDWVMSTEGEGYRNQKEAQTALALKITKWFEEDVTRFLKLHIESRIPYPSAVVFDRHIRPVKTESGEIMIPGYDGDMYEGIAETLGGLSMEVDLFARAYARKLAFKLAKNLDRFVAVEPAFLFCESFCLGVDNALKDIELPAHKVAKKTWSDHALMALGQYYLKPVEAREVELFSRSLLRVAFWENFYENDGGATHTPSADIKDRAGRLGTAAGRRLRYLGYNLAKYFNDTLYETLYERSSTRKRQAGEPDAEDNGEPEADDGVDMMDLRW